MKAEICVFSGFKIHPGRGSSFIRSDSKTFVFVSQKCRSHFNQRHNPRKMAWTVLYRRLHRKGAVEVVAKRRARRTAKFQRGIEGMSLEVLRQKKMQSKEQRAAARQTAVREAKARNKKKAAEKKKGGKTDVAKKSVYVKTLNAGGKTGRKGFGSGR